MTIPPSAAAGIVLLCGRSFSGKSTVAAELAQSLRAVVVSLDDINAEHGFQGGAAVSNDEWIQTHEVSRSRTQASTASGATVIVDDTSSPRSLRDGWRKLAHELEVPLVLVYVDTPVELSLERHAMNRAQPHRMDVTDEILQGHLESFEAPTSDEQPVQYSTIEMNLDSALRQIRCRLVHRLGAWWIGVVIGGTVLVGLLLAPLAVSFSLLREDLLPLERRAEGFALLRTCQAVGIIIASSLIASGSLEVAIVASAVLTLFAAVVVGRSRSQR